LIPVGRGYSALQRAVVECAYAGCETIWITLAAGQEPLIRDQLGDYVEDPVWFYRYKEKYPKENRKQIPIFYVRTPLKDAGRRDCASWGILNSAACAYYTSKKISNWLLPTKYYVAFPFGVYEPSLLREHRNAISSVDKPFYITYDGKSIADGLPLGFTFDTSSFVRIRKQFRDLEKTQRGASSKAARYFKLKDIFNVIDPQFVDGSTEMCLERYSDISFWNGYVDYMSSPFVEYPSSDILKNGKKRFDLPPIL